MNFMNFVLAFTQEKSEGINCYILHLFIAV